MSDLEELEYLETMAQSSGQHLEQVLEETAALDLKLGTARSNYKFWVNRRDTLKAALEGMGVKK